MNNIAFINRIDSSPLVDLPLNGEKSAFERSLDFARSLPGVKKIIVLSDSEIPEKDFILCYKKKWDSQILLDVLNKQAGQFQDIFYFYSDCPFLDADLSQRMYKTHKHYFAGYSYADGYPYGVAPEIVNVKILPTLLNLSKQKDEEKKGVGEKKISRETLFNIIKKDINVFDIETEISPIDLRYLRISLSCDTKLNFVLIENLLKNGFKNISQIIERLTDLEPLLRTLPSYVNLQINDNSIQTPSYLPNFKESSEICLSKNKIITILDQLKDFCPDALLNLSAFGSEPSLFPDLVFLIKEAVDRGFQLIIETSGLGWKDSVVEQIKAVSQEKVDWIVCLDAWDEDLYHSLRGNGYHESTTFVRQLHLLFPDTVYVQAIRIEENEHNLEKFYREWTKLGLKTIIQKYNWYSGRLPQKKVTDLSPLKRQACWHLKRDLVIMADGTIPLCHEDYNNEFSLGNIFKDSLATIWQKADPIYRQHLDGNYPGICRECDEFYTFNN